VPGLPEADEDDAPVLSAQPATFFDEEALEIPPSPFWRSSVATKVSPFVPTNCGPPLAATKPTTASYSTPLRAAISARPSSNCSTVTLRSPFGLIFANIRSMSVLLHALSTSWASLAILLKAFPSISPPAANALNACRTSLLRALRGCCGACGDRSLLDIDLIGFPLR